MHVGWGRKPGDRVCVAWQRGLGGELSLLRQRGRACGWGRGRKLGAGDKPGGGVCVARQRGLGGALSLLWQRGRRTCGWGRARKPGGSVGVAWVEEAGGGHAVPPVPRDMHAKAEGVWAGQGA